MLNMKKEKNLFLKKLPSYLIEEDKITPYDYVKDGNYYNNRGFLQPIEKRLHNYKMLVLIRERNKDFLINKKSFEILMLIKRIDMICFDDNFYKLKDDFSIIDKVFRWVRQISLYDNNIIVYKGDKEWLKQYYKFQRNSLRRRTIELIISHFIPIYSRISYRFEGLSRYSLYYNNSIYKSSNNPVKLFIRNIEDIKKYKFVRNY